MISFDQVLLLEERVESAVKKIEQLNAENAALRAKVAELSNALNAKSEQFSSFQSDQSKIEEGILKALSRLNAVENVVLQASGAAQSVSVSSEHIASEQTRSESVTSTQTQPVAEPVQVVQGNVPEPKEPVTAALSQDTKQVQGVPVQNAVPSFDSMNVSEPGKENMERQAEPVSSEENVQNQHLPQEIDVPVERLAPNTSVLGQDEAGSAGSESIPSDVGFEYGESDPSVSKRSDVFQQAAVAKPVGQNARIEADSQSQSAQPMFDIF